MATVDPLAPIPESAASAGSMTLMLRQLKAGEETALAALHGRYGPLLIARARGRLRDAGAPCRAGDEEDVVQEAFWSFYQSLKAEQIPRLENRRDFLALMTHIVACRVHIHLTRENAQKRGGGATAGDSILKELAASPEPTPLEHAIVEDLERHFLDGLPEPLRPVAELYLAGYKQTEIAAQLAIVPRTVQRKLDLILERWHEMAAVALAE